MRAFDDNGRFAMQIIAGTRSVLLGLDATDEARKGLLGFAIRRDGGGQDDYWLPSYLTFEGREGEGRTPNQYGGDFHEDVDEHDRGQSQLDFEYDPRVQPVQAFRWGDYNAEPDTEYTYTLYPVRGTADAPELDEKDAVAVQISTEPETGDGIVHEIYFNRGAAGSQEYSYRFGSKPPNDLPDVDVYLPAPEVSDRDKAIYKWLSRGLREAMLGFVDQASSTEHGLRAAVYEFNYDEALIHFGAAAGIPYRQLQDMYAEKANGVVEAASKGEDVLQAFNQANKDIQVGTDEALTNAAGTGADVLIVYDAKPDRAVEKEDENGDPIPVLDSEGQPRLDIDGDPIYEQDYEPRGPGDDSQLAISRALINRLVNRRTQPVSAISHNKFVIFLEKTSSRSGLKPQAVWTGSTNWTASGIYGQSNVGHIVRDPDIAATYLHYWDHLNNDPRSADFRPINDRDTPFGDADPAPNSMQVVFSPRGAESEHKYAALERYADLLAASKESVHLTAAFGLSEQFSEAINQGGEHIVYLLLENDGQSNSQRYIEGIEDRADKGELSVRIARGATFDDDALTHAGVLDRWHEETLTGLNVHVKYIHTKYMVLDALTDDPIVISGSANFSEASTNTNDENMLVIRGNTRVAHIYLTEYMRLFEHFHFRDKFNAAFADAGSPTAEDKALLYLTPDDSWTDKHYRADSVQAQERDLYSAFRQARSAVDQSTDEEPEAGA